MVGRSILASPSPTLPSFLLQPPFLASSTRCCETSPFVHPLPTLRLASPRAAVHSYRCSLRGFPVNPLDVRQAWVFRVPRAGCDWVGASPPESPVRRLSGAEKHTAVGAPVDSGPATVSKARCSRTPDLSRDDLISPPGITSRVHLSTPSDGALAPAMTRPASKLYVSWEFVMLRPLGLGC